MEVTTEPIIAVIGHPIAGNPTQFALETALETAQIDARVLSLNLPDDRITAAIHGMAAMGFRGVWIDQSCRTAVQQVLNTSPLPLAGDDTDSASTKDSPLSGSLTCMDALGRSEDSGSSWHAECFRQSAWIDPAGRLLKEFGYSLQKILLIGKDPVRRAAIEQTLRDSHASLGELAVGQIRQCEKLIPAIDCGDINLVILTDDTDSDDLPLADSFTNRQDIGLMVVDLGEDLRLASIPTPQKNTVFIDRVEVHSRSLVNAIHWWFKKELSGSEVPVDRIRDAIEEYLAL